MVCRQWARTYLPVTSSLWFLERFAPSLVTRRFTRFFVFFILQPLAVLCCFCSMPSPLDVLRANPSLASLVLVQCIIMGIPIPLGTGLFKLLMNEDKLKPPPTPELLVE